MKKLLFFLAALMFVTSCSKDTTTTLEVKGEKVVSFKVTAPKIQTRYGEGAEANQLFWAVYKNGQRLDDISAIASAEAVAINMSVDVEISLMEGIDYDILFWAQNENAPYTFDGEKVTIDYDALSANKEIYDAFFRNYHVDADQTEPHRVELRRPFAQLNIGTADTAKAATAGFTLENTSVTVEACTVLDLATGEASEPQELTFAMSQKASDTYGDDPDTFDIISMNYLLVNNEKEVVDVTFNAEGGNDAIEREYLNVPLQRNHRTYILGDILTSSKLFNVYINPAFEDEDLFPEPVKTIIYYTSTDGNIVEPNDKNAFGVKIEDNVYEDGQGKIIFDGVVTKIGDNAFVHRETLTSIILPDCITEIGNKAFYACEILTTANIPNGVIKIGDNAFGYCENLTNITIPDSVEKIGELAFTQCHRFTTITIPNSVVEIGYGAISCCSNLVSAVLPENLSKISGSLFCYDNSLKDIVIPNGVTEIGDQAFGGCDSLTSIIIPDNVTKIGGWAFMDCYSLVSITIPDNVMEIGDGMCHECNNLTNVIIGDGVTTIPYWAFYCCSKLTSVVLGDNVTHIGDGAFGDCGVVDINIHDNVKVIDESAFYGCDFTDLIIGDGVEEIGSAAFQECVNLRSVVIGDSVTKIGSSAFSDCIYLSNITIPDSVTEIGSWAFNMCGIESFTIPANVTKIGSSVFNETQLSSLHCKPTTPPVGVSDLFGVGVIPSIYVPTASVDDYKNADGWSDYADRIVDGEF